MSPWHVVEPTYRTLKQRLIEGYWPLGRKLEAVRLAGDLGVSMTPVRDSLNRLVGERLVELRPGEGFRVMPLTERGLRDLFEFNAALLVFALQVGRPGRDSGGDAADEINHAAAIARLFAAMAASAGNAVLAETVAALSDQLHAARMLDPELLSGCEEELRQIARDYTDGADKAALRRRLIAYHERRREAAPLYVEALSSSRD